MTTQPIRVGLVGAGPWARTLHAPLHAAGGQTELVGVWARRLEAAQTLGQKHGVPAFERYEELLDVCDAVAFAVPPQVQAAMAPQAAAAGKALLLEKPLAAGLDEARVVADAVAEHGVVSIVAMARRYHPRTRDFITAAEELRSHGPVEGVTGCYLHGGFLTDGFLKGAAAGTWRVDPFGALLDLGPHLLDIVDAAAGPVVAVRADGDPSGYLGVSTRHADGGLGQFALSGLVAVQEAQTRVDLYSRHGTLHYTTDAMGHEVTWENYRTELASAVHHGTPVTVDAARALHVQAILEAALTAHGTGRWEQVA